MQILKLALPLAGALFAGQALAHKASHFAAMTQTPARPASLQTGANPAALLGGMAGRAAHSTPAALRMMLPEPPAQSTEKDYRINRHH